ncbi:MAG: hypothetical protein RI885_22 [Actinomycetota bacterium]|jgi:AcrR family transcriptional regulator
MSRRADPDRRPRLVASIIEYLLDHPLSSMSFRTVAEHLDVSTFTLVYHFGTKSSLIAAVVGGVRAEQLDAVESADIRIESVDTFFDGIVTYWHGTLDSRSRQLQRIEFEAALLESFTSDAALAARRSLDGWHGLVRQGLIDLGVPESLATAESRAMASMLYGLRYDLVVLGDREGATAAFDRGLEVYRERVRSLTRSGSRG